MLYSLTIKNTFHFFERIITILSTLAVAMLIAGCGGPFSILPYMASASLGAYETHRIQEEAERKRYINKCLPTQRPIDALIAGVNAEREAAHIIVKNPENIQESQTKLIHAYEYYKISETLGDRRARARLKNIRRFMSNTLVEQAENGFRKYTLENILSCYEAPGKG